MSKYTYVVTETEAFGSHFLPIDGIKRHKKFVHKELSSDAVEQIPLSHVNKIVGFDDVEQYTLYLLTENYGVQRSRAQEFFTIIQELPQMLDGETMIDELQEALIEQHTPFDKITHSDDGKEREVKRRIAEDIILLAALENVIDLSGNRVTAT